MRLAIILALIAQPVAASEFRATEICELRHEMAEAQVRLTYDPRIPEYSIELTREAPWAASPWFAMRFEGPRGLTISTDRHGFLDGDRSTVADRDSGFGNVLDGLEFNARAVAFTQNDSLSIPLDGAAGPVGEFRACTIQRLS